MSLLGPIKIGFDEFLSVKDETLTVVKILLVRLLAIYVATKLTTVSDIAYRREGAKPSRSTAC